jgi:hypothetical protein
MGVLECHQFQIVDTSIYDGGIKPMSCVRNPMGFMVEAQARNFFIDKVEVQVRILLS